MALCLVRAGKYGEREDFALKNKMVVIGWDDVPDLAAIKDRKELAALLAQVYLDAKPKTLMAWESQLWAFSKDIAIGELVAMPLKHRSVIALGRSREIMHTGRITHPNPVMPGRSSG
jgi:restriction system protein